MKKILFLLFAVVLSSSVFAEDVITTSEGEIPYYIPNYGGVSIYQFDEPTLVRQGSKVFKDGVQMSQRDYKNFLQNTCPEAFKKYKQGKQLTDAGWSLLPIGVVMAIVVGVPHMTESSYWYTVTEQERYYDYYTGKYKTRTVRRTEHEWNDEMWASGLSMVVIGSVTATVVSIPMLCVGYNKRKKSVDTYNRNCSSDISLNITAGNNGLGFAINF